MPHIYPGEDGDNRPALTELANLGFTKERDFRLYLTWDGHWIVRCSDAAYDAWTKTRGVAPEPTDPPQPSEPTESTTDTAISAERKPRRAPKGRSGAS